MLREQGLLLEPLPAAPRTTDSRHSLPVFRNLVKDLELDGDYQKVRALSSRRDDFFYHLQAALRYALHETWRGFLIFARGDDSGDIPDG